MVNRRGFLASLAGAAAIALDPDRALWVPGAKLISVPAPSVVEHFFYWFDYAGRLYAGPAAHSLACSVELDVLSWGANDDPRNLFHPASVGLREP
jgi:hypothetical protein